MQIAESLYSEGQMIFSHNFTICFWEILSFIHISQVLIHRTCFKVRCLSSLTILSWGWGEVGGRGSLKTATRQVQLQRNERCPEPFLALSNPKSDLLGIILACLDFRTSVNLKPQREELLTIDTTSADSVGQAKNLSLHKYFLIQHIRGKSCCEILCLAQWLYRITTHQK